MLFSHYKALYCDFFNNFVQNINSMKQLGLFFAFLSGSLASSFAGDYQTIYSGHVSLFQAERIKTAAALNESWT
jgi:hypothetical protein